MLSQIYGAPTAIAATQSEGFTTAVARGAGMEEAQAKRGVEAWVKQLHADLAEGRGVEIQDLGTFYITKRTAKVLPGQPPAAPKKSVRFAVADNLKDLVAK